MLSFTVVLLILFLTIVYYYIKYVYFTLRGPIPGIPPQFLFGNLLQTGMLGRDECISSVFLKLKVKLGDVFQYWFSSTRILVVSSLEDVQHIYANRYIYDQADSLAQNLSLVNSSEIICLKGAKYKRHASVTNPLFRGSKVLLHLDTIIDCTDKLLARWHQVDDPTRIHLNINDQAHQLVLAIFGFIAFDYDFQTLDDECEKGKTELVRAMDIYLSTAFKILEMPFIVSHIYLFFNIKYRRARLIIDQYMQRMIEQELTEAVEIRTERKRTSLIAALVSSLQQDEKLEATKTEEEKKGLSREEVKGLILSFLSAGYSTVASVLAWFIYLMSKYPEVQAKIKKELAEYNFQRLTNEQLNSLIYLDCVIREVLRFVPTSLGSLRTVVADDQLPKSGFHIKKGEHVFISFHTLARDARYWLDPDRFYPERFLNESESIDNNKAALIPFGGGHRQCSGQDLGRLEVKAICARLMQHVTFVDGGPILNSGGYYQTDTIKPKYIGVAIKFD